MPSWLVPLPDEIVGKALEADKMSPEVLAWHWKNVLDPIVQEMELYIDYFELCAKEVYDNPEVPEDIW